MMQRKTKWNKNIFETNNLEEMQMYDALYVVH